MAEIPAMPTSVPGSVQNTLREAGVLPDWNVGLNFRDCEWVENRHWVYEVYLPDDWMNSAGMSRVIFECLDGCGEVFLNAKSIGTFTTSHLPHSFDLDGEKVETGNILRVVFTEIPRWLGQFGYTSQMKDWKVRFNYTWDWTVRLVQIGIAGPVTLQKVEGSTMEDVLVRASVQEDGKGSVLVTGSVSNPEGQVQVAVTGSSGRLAETVVSATDFSSNGISLKDLPVDLWWPNLEGEQPLYNVALELLDGSGNILDTVKRRVGFRTVTWDYCDNTPEGAHPWICVVNGRKVFLQGINWTPIRPNWADVEPEDYRKLLETYKQLGVNILRVWGGAFLEQEIFYDICDELGLMVWQEFPLSSSGVDNWPPEDNQSIDQMAEIARSFVLRRRGRCCLIMWCGGNELQSATGPCDLSHPMLKRLGEVVQELDSGTRFMETSPSGPAFYADPGKFGTGIHWDVHGPWKSEDDFEHWKGFWEGDDSLLRSEMGAPGASSAEIIRHSAGQLDPMPANESNALWRRTSPWWIEWDLFVKQNGKEPDTLEEYVQWSQERQKQLLSYAVQYTKDRFPTCGGIIIWMGHDCFPCTANTSIIDFYGLPKPAGVAIGEIFNQKRREG